MVAIGEIGLDYHYDHSPREVQQEVFRKQLAYAKEVDLPVVIHSREAEKDTLDNPPAIRSKKRGVSLLFR